MFDEKTHESISVVSDKWYLNFIFPIFSHIVSKDNVRHIPVNAVFCGGKLEKHLMISVSPTTMFSAMKVEIVAIIGDLTTTENVNLSKLKKIKLHTLTRLLKIFIFKYYCTKNCWKFLVKPLISGMSSHNYLHSN